VAAGPLAPCYAADRSCRSPRPRGNADDRSRRQRSRITVRRGHQCRASSDTGWPPMPVLVLDLPFESDAARFP
jgi:hypothetical protein